MSQERVGERHAEHFEATSSDFQARKIRRRSDGATLFAPPSFPLADIIIPLTDHTGDIYRSLRLALPGLIRSMLRRVLVSRSCAFARCVLGGQHQFLSSTPNKRSSRGKIYTRGGDGGTSVLISSGATRVPKSSCVFDVLGTLDELSSVMGVVLSSISPASFPSICKQLERIQCDLFDIGSCVAARNRSSRFQFNDQQLIDQLEEEIDRMTDNFHH